MPAQFDHSIVLARDPMVSATFLARVLGVKPPAGPANIPEEAKGVIPAFVTLTLDGASFDYIPTPKDQSIPPHHFGFRCSEEEFDEALARIKEDGIVFFAYDYPPNGPGGFGEVQQTADGGRVIYFKDPDNHLMELVSKGQHKNWQ
jgi:catechol 2,3-dioxygenase-like lactoylglutathione lyase family enzyme